MAGPSNSIMVIMPYRYGAAWVFDDAALGLHHEALIGGTPEMMAPMLKEIPDAEKGFQLYFSAQPFPGWTQKLIWRRGDQTGNWYYSEQSRKEGWLCPSLFKYFSDAPKEMYLKAEKK